MERQKSYKISSELTILMALILRIFIFEWLDVNDPCIDWVMIISEWPALPRAGQAREIGEMIRERTQPTVLFSLYFNITFLSQPGLPCVSAGNVGNNKKIYHRMQSRDLRRCYCGAQRPARP